MNRRQFLSAVGVTTTGLHTTTAAVAEPDDSPPRVRLAVQLPRNYRGRSQLTYQATGTYGDPVEPREIALPSQISLSQPATFGGLTESNPFSFVISTGDPANQGSPTLDEGAMLLVSALESYTPETGREVLLQYWEVDHAAGSGELSGELANTQTSVSSAINTLWVADEGIFAAPGPTPAWPDEGTTMQGRVTNRAVRLVVSGTANPLYSGSVEFTVVIRGRRTP